MEYEPICMFCRHQRLGNTCKAFPKQIPDSIFARGNAHTSAMKGDHGIRFEVKPKDEDFLRRQVEAGIWPKKVLATASSS